MTLHLLNLLAAAALILAVALLVAVTPLGARVRRRLRADREAPAPRHAARLDAESLPPPSVALACAAREVVRLADLVELMLRTQLKFFLEQRRDALQSARSTAARVDECFGEIKHFLTALRRTPISREDERRWTELMAFAIALEQIADTVERVLDDLEAAAASETVGFSTPAVAEVCTCHSVLMHNFRLAVHLLMERDAGLARSLEEAAGAFLSLEWTYSASHLERLTAGDPTSAGTSAAYLDLLGDLERMNTLVCSLGSCFLRLERAADAREVAGAAPLLVGN